MWTSSSSHWGKKTDNYQYTMQKGFCEDLEEGKYSLPLIHLIHSIPSDLLLRNILVQRRVNGRSSLAHKQTILDLMKAGGSLKFTADTLDVLYIKVEKSIGELEKKFGVENLELRLMLEMLKI